MLEMYTSGRQARVRVSHLLLEHHPDNQDAFMERTKVKSVVVNGAPVAERLGVHVNPEDDLETFRQCVLECEYSRGRTQRQALRKAFLAADNPSVLWGEGDLPSYQMMHLIGTATDQYGPVVKLGKGFNRLTEQNLAAMQNGI